jgi:UDP-glucose 4-epimerase
MRILITGKNSYIGNSFKNFLKDKPEFQVDAISVRDNYWKTKSFKDYDVIIHLAALVHKNERKYTLKDYERVNVQLTLDIAKKAIEEGVTKFIFFSTMAVFGKVKIIKKETPLNPISKYGITKLRAEQVLKSFLENSKMILTIIRPPMIYGVGARGNPGLIEQLSKYISIFPETFNRRSFISIENLNRILFNQLNLFDYRTIHPQDPKYLTTFELFRYYRKNVKKIAFPMIILGYILKKITFIGFINKVFGDLYYDFND